MSVDWQHWKQIKQLKISEAVFLSVDFDPRYSPASQGFKNDDFSPVVAKFQEKCDIALNHADSGDLPLVKFYGLSIYKNSLGPKDSIVVLSTFGDWAKSMGWDIPEEFPTTKQAEKNDPVFSYSTPLLEVMRETIKLILSEENDLKKDYLVKKIKEIGASNDIDVADRIADAMFTIIKRENHNPRKPKKKA